jgi:hypothetical protein
MDMKQMAALRVKLNQADSLLGQRKSSTRKTTSNLGIKDPDLLTEQMLAERWYCSTSRLQRWRARNTGPTYLKIGGKVMYRQEDVSAYEDSALGEDRTKNLKMAMAIHTRYKRFMKFLGNLTSGLLEIEVQK